MKSKVLFLSLLFSLGLSSIGSASENSINVLLDNEKITFEVEPQIEDGTTLVQFRPLFEKLGLTIVWDSGTKKITGTKEGLEIVLQIDNKTAYVNGKQIDLDVAPKIVEGNTVVPLRFVGEAANKDVAWKPEDDKINITTKSTVNESNVNKQKDFREVTWGMTKEQVKKLETSKLIGEKENAIAYNGTVSEVSSGILYTFADNKLVSAGYLISSPTLSTYDDFKKILTEKYGKPDVDIAALKSNLNGSKSNDLKFDNFGRLSNTVTWETNKTTIIMSIEGSNFNVTDLSILYKDKTYVQPKKSGKGL